MREHGVGAAPLEPVALEVEPAQHGRGGGQRVERAEHVVAKAGLDELGGPHGASHLLLLLEHDDVPAPVGEQVGGDETVVTRADDDGIRHGELGAALDSWASPSRAASGSTPPLCSPSDPRTPSSPYSPPATWPVTRSRSLPRPRTFSPSSA